MAGVDRASPAIPEGHQPSERPVAPTPVRSSPGRWHGQSAHKPHGSRVGGYRLRKQTGRLDHVCTGRQVHRCER
jgi:hypothetical protein